MGSEQAAGTIMGLIIGIGISALISGAVIWVVSKLNMGLTVKNFGWAMLAGLLIGLVSNLIAHLVVAPGGVVGWVINLVIAAVVIMICGAILKGLEVKGFLGAAIAALAISAIYYLLAMAFIGAASV